MAYGPSTRRPAPYNYETPEQKARDQLRAQKTIAGVTTRANEQAQSVAALQALAKATGVPMSQLPAGGIHPGMSPADVQAATDRINGWVARQPAGGAGQAARPASTENISPAGAAVASALGLPAPTPPATANATPAPQTRTTPTGGTETLVPSESGPRWVASVNNVPAPNNLNGEVTRNPGGQTQQVQSNPIALRPTAPGQPVASVAQNLAFAQNPTSAVPTPKPWAPSSSPEVITPRTDAAKIAFQYGDKTGGMVTNGPSAPGVNGYAGTGVNAPPYVPPAVGARVASNIAPKPLVPPVPSLVPPVPPIIPPVAGNAIPGLPANAGATGTPALSDTPLVRNATTPPVPSPIPGIPPITGANPVAPITAGQKPFDPDADDEENRKRLAIATGKAPPVPAPTSAVPYQF